MTGNDVYQKALGLMFEEDTDDYKNVLVPVLNVLISECAAANETIRRYKGMEPLTEVPQITAATDDLGLEPELCYAALPYGLAAKLVYDDNDMGKVSYFQGLYVSTVNAVQKLCPSEIEDVYSGDV